jgi:serine/threonine protein kinase
MTSVSGCPRCGTPVTAGARFCANCGSDVSTIAGSVTVSTVSGPPSPTPRDALLEMLREATLGEYEVLGELGRGGMATVYLAHDIALDRKVAIKVISPSLLAGEGMVERFKREARTAASLSHPHIIPIYAVKETDRILYFVMKFVEGRPVDSLIREVGAIPIPMVQAILHQAGGALAYAHRRGVVHRDVKPANIMVDEEGWAVVTDFGIAKISAAQALTMTGVTVGTPAYMSPEQCAAHPVTGASDQYSLAVVVYEMLTGRPPFAAESIMALMFAHFNEPVPPIHDARPDCPPELEAAVMRMLEKAPDQRWRNIEEAIVAAGGAALAQDEDTRRSMTDLARAGDTTELLRRFSTPASPIPSVKASRIGAGSTMALVVAVSVSPSAKTLRVGQNVQLVATVRDANGVPHPERTVSWASNAPGVATVSPSGLLSAVAPGSAIITATSEGVSGTTAVTVTAPPARSVAAEAVAPLPARGGRRVPAGIWVGVAAAVVAGGVWASTHDWRGGSRPEQEQSAGATTVAALVVSPAADSLVVGGQLQLAAVARDADGVVLADHRVKWASSQPAIARVSSTGLISGEAPGVATITVSSEGRSATAAVSVRAAVGSVALTPADTTLRAGEIILMKVAMRDAAGNALRDRPLRWSSSDDRVATVTSLGMVSAVGAGRATITAASEGRSAGASVAVTAAPVQSGPPAAVATVVVVPNQVNLLVGETAQLSALLRDARGAPLTGRSIAWTSADPGIATVASNGAVTAIRDGTTRITAGSERRSATALVTVTAPLPPAQAAVASIDVTPDPGTLRVGETQQLRAIPRDAAGASLSGRPVQWSSGQPGVATVSGGLVTAVGAGKTTISASSEGQRTGVEVTVVAAPTVRSENDAADIAAVLTTFTAALESRQMAQVLRAYPGMSPQEQQRWAGLLEERTVTDFSTGLAQLQAPTIEDSSARVDFAITLNYRSPTEGRTTHSVPYRATLSRTPTGWRLQSLQQRR